MRDSAATQNVRSSSSGAQQKPAGGVLDESTFLARGKDLACGDVDALTADLEPGPHEFVCLVPGHFLTRQKRRRHGRGKRGSRLG